MLDLKQDIRSLSDFKRNTLALTRELRRSGHPLVLTVNGAASLVVQDAEAYQRLLALAERAEAVQGIRRGLDAMARDESLPADTVLAEMRRKVKARKPR